LIAKEEIKKSQKPRLWQNLFYNDDLLLNVIWKKLDTKGKLKVHKFYYGLFLSLRAAMPLSTARRLYDLLKSNKLLILDKIKKIKFEEGNFSIGFKKNLYIKAPQIVNATGLSNNILKTDNTFIKNLLSNKIIQSNLLGGINVTNTYQCTNELPSNNIYAIGALTYGSDILTNLIEYIVQSTYIATSDMLGKLK